MKIGRVFNTRRNGARQKLINGAKILPRLGQPCRTIRLAPCATRLGFGASATRSYEVAPCATRLGFGPGANSLIRFVNEVLVRRHRIGKIIWC